MTKKNIIFYLIIFFLLILSCSQPIDSNRFKDAIPKLPGTIEIIPNDDVLTGTTLTAEYTPAGNEIISGWQWKNYTTSVGENMDTFTPEVSGSYTVTVFSDGYESITSIPVIVNAPSGTEIIESIYVSSLPTKMEYLIGENFNPTGMVVTAVLKNGLEKPVSEYSINEIAFDQRGYTTLTITYEDFSTTLTVKVVANFSVTFDRDNGSALLVQQIREGNRLIRPTDPRRTNFAGPISNPGLYLGGAVTTNQSEPDNFPYIFLDWFTEDGEIWDFDTEIYFDIVLTARYSNGHSPIDISDLEGDNIIIKALSYIRENPTITGYSLYLDHDVDLEPQVLDWTYAIFSIYGFGDHERRIKLSGNGTLFTVGVESSSNFSVMILLTIGNNITLEGHNNNNAPLIIVRGVTQRRGNFIMLEGSRITGNTSGNYYNSQGAAVHVTSSGIFSMRGGEISGNTSTAVTLPVGGVTMEEGSNGTSFRMDGGRIIGNTSAPDQYDVFVRDRSDFDNLNVATYPFQMSGNATIGSILLRASSLGSPPSPRRNGVIVIDPDWTGNTELPLQINLTAESFPTLLTRTMEYWENRLLVRSWDRYYDFQDYFKERFTLGNFIVSGNALIPINDTHVIINSFHINETAGLKGLRLLRISD